MSLVRLRYALAGYVVVILVFPVLSIAQDSTVSRFEAGGSVTAIRQIPFSADLGPGLDGDINFGRHLALDAAFNWLPSSFSHTVNGFFGAKLGARTDRFGLFGKVRPGFFSTSHTLLGSTINIDTLLSSTRFGRLTDRALDMGGVIELYPSRRWLMRWDMGNTLLFQQAIPFVVTGTNPPPSVSRGGGTSNHFQFSTSVHYRF